MNTIDCLYQTQPTENETRKGSVPSIRNALKSLWAIIVEIIDDSHRYQQNKDARKTPYDYIVPRGCLR